MLLLIGLLRLKVLVSVPSADRLIPPLGTIPLDFRLVARWVAQGLFVHLSMALGVHTLRPNNSYSDPGFHHHGFWLFMGKFMGIFHLG